MIEKVTIAGINRHTANKDGVPYIGKNDKPYTRVGIVTVERGEGVWLSGFDNPTNATWKKDDIVEIVVEQKGEWLNFKTPTEEDRLKEKVAVLEAQVAEAAPLPDPGQIGTAPVVEEEVVEDVNPDEIPFN